MNIKKLLAVLLTAAMTISMLAACGLKGGTITPDAKALAEDAAEFDAEKEEAKKGKVRQDDAKASGKKYHPENSGYVWRIGPKCKNISAGY